MKLSRKFEWMRGYIHLGMTFLPDEVIISRVSHWTLGKSRGKDVNASIFQDGKGPFRIYLHTHYEFGEENRPFSKIDLLTNLAHEMAHTIDWKHTPKHKSMESKILSAFMKKLKRDGYISEEEELGG